MNKFIKLLQFMIIFFITILSIDNIIALDKVSKELQLRLNKVNNFYGFFIQRVINDDGIVIQNNNGYLWLKKPYFLKCDILIPDKQIIISDGINVWFYNILTRQVTITLFKNIFVNTPLLLITNNTPKDWEKYKIIKNNNKFIIFFRKKNKKIKFFTITILSHGLISQFSIIDYNNQKIIYDFKNVNNKNINKKEFNFVIPKDVTVDDQR
uniref:Outer-membrane lipoprotein carrier protein n=1 Tax=Candidatus Aschnera chinzeii TaxID=1485666 RepID=A0AAT9G417_9ENTR|nr:MAG: outer membrane lipoprotein chaperone LolA [Candidatus Aschnera chinzeii]